jgi:peptide-methionine (S)-S-oxide reductase
MLLSEWLHKKRLVDLNLPKRKYYETNMHSYFCTSAKVENMRKEATLGAGCFWCIEACYKDLKGVIDVYPGYSGGHTIDPTYKAVCEGATGHAEVARVEFNDDVISFEEILEIFWFVQ